MKIFAPDYYKKFKCIADKCTRSCCVGWRIEIDEATFKKYESLGESVINSIELDSDGSAHFILCENGRCPHLDETGLCKIIMAHGEENLSDICREHPRFYNYLPNRVEVGIGLVCEEAARLILSSEYRNFIEVGEDVCEAFECEFDALAQRERIYRILSDDSLSYEVRLYSIYEKYSISPSKLSADAWQEVILSLEYINEENRERFLSFSADTKAPKYIEKYLERALAYFIFRHTSKEESEAEFSASLGLALFLERLYASLLNKCEKIDTDTAVRLASLISEEIEYSEENVESIKFAYI